MARRRAGAGWCWPSLLLLACLLGDSCGDSGPAFAAGSRDSGSSGSGGSGSPDDFLVRIVSAEDGQPLAGAVLHWLSPTLHGSADFELQGARGLDAESSIASVARRFESDGRGELRLPLVAGEHSFIVRHGERLGLYTLGGHEREPFVVRIASELHASQRSVPAIAPGVVAEHHQPPLDDSSTVRVQLVDIFEQPLRHEVVTWDLRSWSSGEAYNRGAAVTDGDGWFELVGQHDSHAPVHFDALSLRMPEAYPPRAAELELGGIQLGEAVDLGAVEMEPLDLLLAGRVLDSSRRPVRRALVRYEARTRGGTWFDGEAITWPTGSDGRFELYGEQGELQSLRAIATKPGLLPRAPVVTRIGRREVELWLEPAGSLELRLDGLAGLEERDLYELDLALMTALEVLPPDERPSARLARWGQLEPGEYTLRMQVRGEVRPFARMTGLEVRAGEVLQDPRLSPYDLSGELWAFDLRAFDEQGDPLDSVEWRVGHSDGGAREYHGEAVQRVLSSRKEIEVWAHAEGFRSAHLRRVRTSRRVVMRPGIEVEVALLGDVRLAPGVSLLGGLTRAGAVGAGAPMEPLRFDAQGNSQLALSAPGIYEVNAGLFHGASETFVSFAGFDEGVLAEIEVLDALEPQRFELALNPRLVELARSELLRDD